MIRTGNNYTLVYINGENKTTLWPGKYDAMHGCVKQMPLTMICSDGVPPDGRPTEMLDATHISAFIVFTFLFGVLLVFAIGCLLFNIIFRKRRYAVVNCEDCNSQLAPE